MLAVSPLRSTRDEESFNSMGASNDEFADLSDANLLESINFDDLFVGINVDGDVLPDLEMDGGGDMFAEFSGTTGGREESSVDNCCGKGGDVTVSAEEKQVEGKSNSGSGRASGSDCGTSGGEEIVSKSPSPKDGGKGRKSSSQSKSNPQGKRKVKVDWTPELHRRFVQAVEQLGVEKAVPSRILEIMGIDGLTRHNIASHLQKYRSHRKHLLAREAEAAKWSQRRQMYGGGAKGAPTMGFPPITPMHHFRPLHVWGHPSSMDQSFMHMWPKHPPISLSPPPLPPPSWLPPAPSLLPPPDPSFWYAQHQRAPNVLTPGTPCFSQPLTTTRFGSPPVPGIPPHAMCKVDPSIGVPAGPRPLVDFHPSKESIDAAIGDVLSKPWLPLPLGLKAPVLDSVLGELQRQGIPNIPPS